MINDETFKNLIYVTWMIALALSLSFGVTTLVHTYPHDWDCAKHNGVVPMPGSPYTAEIRTYVICQDGYRP